MDKQPRLLLIEDDPDTASLIAEALTDHFGEGCVQCHATVAEARTAEIERIDLVICDMNLPDGSGLDVLDDMLARQSDLPVVFVTAEGILDNAVAAIRRGAYDYIVKTGDYLFSIPLIVEKNLAIWKTKHENQQLQEQLAKTLDQVRVKNTQLEEAVEQLQTMAATDPLTGLANRRAFADALSRALAEASRSGHELACIMIDVDGFKKFNDTYGHQQGDALLQGVAHLLLRCCRRSDVAGRFGGDEFIILLPQSDAAKAGQVAQRILAGFVDELRAISDDPTIEGATTLSMGLATLSPREGMTPEQLIANADEALYVAKQAGKNRLVVYDAAPPGQAVSA